MRWIALAVLMAGCHSVHIKARYSSILHSAEVEVSVKGNSR